MIGRTTTFLFCLLAGISDAQTQGMRPVQEWPLGACANNPVSARICLDGPTVWEQFGHGAPEIEVAVVETFETFAMGQIMAQHPWLQHLDIPQFWHAQKDDVRAQPRPQVLRQPQALKDQAPGVVDVCEDLENDVDAQPPSYCEELELGKASFARAYLDWRNANQHELKMIGLIAGQSAGTLRRTGLTPLGSVSLHYIETTPSEVGLESLARRLNRRPGVRVVNFSNEGPFEEMLDLQYARIYRTALTLNAGRRGRTGEDPNDRLLVASSANTTGVFSQTSAYPSPHPLLPPEAKLDLPIAQYGPNHRPVIAYALPPPDVPVLVVGGITYDGKLAGRTRVEPMIDLYAPSGVDWRKQNRSRATSATSQLLAVQNMQNCQGGPVEIANDAVATLDWGQTRDIRSALFLEKTDQAWKDAGDSAIFGPVGCLAPVDIDNGVLLDRIIGNSVATALVSAVAAQMFTLDPQLSATDARDILVSTARANRVSGLPVLDAKAALNEVLARYVTRSSMRWFPGADPMPKTIVSRSLGPGLMGQSAWRRLRDDPPLEINYVAIVQRSDTQCIGFSISLTTQVRAIGDRRVRTADASKITRRPIPCSRRFQ